MMQHYERVCAYVDLDAIKKNYEQIKKCIDEYTRIIAVIKTDCYGHGAVAIAKELEELPYIWGYAAATAQEAFLLRKAGMKKPILILGYTFPSSYEEMILKDIRPALFREDSLIEWEKAAKAVGKKAKVHIKVDSAMSRIGIQTNEEGIAFIKEVAANPYFEIEGIFSHFAKADAKGLEEAKKQLAKYTHFLEKVEECGISIPLKHCSNSAAAIRLKEANMDLVRVGIAQYGLWPSEEMPKSISLYPALSLKSQVVHVKEIEKGTQVSYGGTFEAEHKMTIATIPVGYGDGYPRSLSNKGYVLIKGEKAPILGRVCMDQFMVDVTHIPGVQNGDEVTLIGRDADKQITMEELGDLSGRFNYELACDLGKRIPRAYTKENKIIAIKDYYDDFTLKTLN